jgi:hypothetical protein
LTGLEKHGALSKILNANLANGANCANFSGVIGDIRLFAAFALKILEKISDFEKAIRGGVAIASYSVENTVRLVQSLFFKMSILPFPVRRINRERNIE